MNHISTLSHVHEELELLGHEAVLHERSVAVRIGGTEVPFSAVITHNEATNHFQISCMIASLGQIGEANLTKFALAALDANTRILPFAYALLTDSDDPAMDEEQDWSVVLTHSLPIGDLSREELGSAMSSLLTALLDSANVIGVLGEP